MKIRLTLAITLITIGIIPGHAGSLKNGVWSAEGCGKQPEAPTVYDNDLAAYNESIKAINDWQQQSRAYFECVIHEANLDNQRIVDTTNEQQAMYRQTLEKISATAKAAANNFTQP